MKKIGKRAVLLAVSIVFFAVLLIASKAIVSANPVSLNAIAKTRVSPCVAELWNRTEPLFYEPGNAPAIRLRECTGSVEVNEGYTTDEGEVVAIRYWACELPECDPYQRHEIYGFETKSWECKEDFCDVAYRKNGDFLGYIIEFKIPEDFAPPSYLDVAESVNVSSDTFEVAKEGYSWVVIMPVTVQAHYKVEQVYFVLLVITGILAVIFIPKSYLEKL